MAAASLPCLSVPPLTRSSLITSFVAPWDQAQCAEPSKPRNFKTLHPVLFSHDRSEIDRLTIRQSRQCGNLWLNSKLCTPVTCNVGVRQLASQDGPQPHARKHIPHTHTHLCVYIHMYMQSYVHMYLHKYLYTEKVYASIYICVCVCVSASVNIYIYIYTHT